MSKASPTISTPAFEVKPPIQQSKGTEVIKFQKSYWSQFNSDYGTWQYTWQPEPKPYTPAVLGYEPQQQGIRGNNMTFYDTMPGRVVTIGVSGVCAAAEWALKGAISTWMIRVRSSTCRMSVTRNASGE